ncbi:cytolytic toxin-alpha-like [Engraulis encrasicolus]|uniref:cytolytic toxin-alpha-like n=1 Tax=Engraulis encrasicolus TaxID=184585 RepID=UPI002FCF4E92
MAEIKCANDSMEVISALSRPFRLGMLYDACSDRIVPGVSIWKTEDVTNATRVSLQPNMRYQVADSKSTRDKTNLLDVSASVKLSFCAGLIEAGGSAHYLNSQTSSHQQCSITLHYHQTTDFKELMISELAAPQPEVFDMTDATHVVVGLLYGADALMEFQQSVSSEESKQDIEGELNVMIKKIPGIQIDGHGKVTMNDEDKKKVQNFNCKFYGDVQVNSIPSTYEGAVQLYQNLPHLLGDNGEKAVPVKVWLYPLSKLNNTDMKLKRMISKTLGDEAETVMDDFHQAKMRINDLLEQSKKIKVEAITKQLKDFQGSLSVFSTVFLSKLSKLIPAIRRGQDKTETDMAKLLQARDTLGFSGEQMKQWLDQKETEINIVTAYLKSLGDENKAPEKSPNVDIKPPGPELESYLLQPDVGDVYVFSFTSLEYEEPYLEKVKEAPKKLEDILSNSTPEHKTEQEDPWYMKEDARKALKESKEIFEALQEKAKIISFISDQDYSGASIRLYQNGDLKDRHVTSKDDSEGVPSPGPIQFVSVQLDSVSLRWSPPEGAPGNYTYKVTWTDGQSDDSLEVRTGVEADVTGLTPGEKYHFTVATLSQDGRQSTPVEADVYLGVPPPGPIQFVSVQPDSLSLRWSPPEGAPGNYTFSVNWKGGLKHVTDNALKVEELYPGEMYRFTVATLSKDGRQSTPVEGAEYTEVPPPENLNVVEVSLAATLTWTKPARVDQVTYLLKMIRNQEVIDTIKTESCSYSIISLLEAISVTTVLNNGRQSKPAFINL